VIFPDFSAPAFLATYGYWAVAGLIGLESIGIPLPGETALIAAAVLSGSTNDLNIVLVIVFASAGAIIGDSIGFWIGHKLGFRLLRRYGERVGLTEPRLKLGRYMFMRHGGKVVFLGRFVSLLRTLAALFAGANRMHWPRFLMFNATGGIVWATTYGLAAYFAGQTLHRINGTISFLLLGLGAIAVVVGVLLVRRHEDSLIAEAERALPGPLE
jgi:membrane protein DedA with SNARE-associated domain